ncbi:MFS general substrate transporter [Aspergillus saccharolyticus JOP 1030-1]|uniref:MFS general substrate transporter n=1 Tax=Aspergillus saccharolyticus JOP 1030-1 TaxID=1450539 RepID=A0A318ZAQ9_9EURO|nr:MFS general substrate transporter [Aspergillus saccharolyticus JOP 1030-1]PYH44436.1 MFS general substrate transporter [Aspergillus saccharolyticus JOP 1030-1]
MDAGGQTWEMALDHQDNGSSGQMDGEKHALADTARGVERGEHGVNSQAAFSESNTIKTRRLVVLLGSLWLGTLLMALDETMIATIATPIANSLSAASSFSWITTAYVIGSTVSQAISGHLANAYGRRKALAVNYFLFSLGTLFCGLATRNLPLFLVGRALQGTGGGAIASITSVVETDLIPAHQRALIEGLGSMLYGMCMAIGGVYGAAIDAAIGWRWAFLIQVPIIALDGGVVFRYVTISDQRANTSAHRLLDVVGMVTLMATIVLLQFGLNHGSTTFAWAAAGTIAPLCLVVPCFFLFLYSAYHAESPVVPIRVLMQRSVGLIQITAFFNTGCFVSSMFYVPLYLQVLGLSAFEASLRLIPLAVAFGVCSGAVGYLVVRLRRYYHLNIFLLCIATLGYGLLCSLGRGSSDWKPFVFLGIIGIGVGGTYVTNLMGVLMSVSEEHLATVQSASWAVRSVGVVVGLTVSSVILQTTLHTKLEAIGIKAQQDNITGLDTVALHGDQKQLVIQAYMDALRYVFYSLLAQGVVSILPSLFIENREIPNNEDSS